MFESYVTYIVNLIISFGFNYLLQTKLDIDANLIDESNFDYISGITKVKLKPIDLDQQLKNINLIFNSKIALSHVIINDTVIDLPIYSIFSSISTVLINIEINTVHILLTKKDAINIDINIDDNIDDNSDEILSTALNNINTIITIRQIIIVYDDYILTLNNVNFRFVPEIKLSIEKIELCATKTIINIIQIDLLLHSEIYNLSIKQIIINDLLNLMIFGLNLSTLMPISNDKSSFDSNINVTINNFLWREKCQDLCVTDTMKLKIKLKDNNIIFEELSLININDVMTITHSEKSLLFISFQNKYEIIINDKINVKIISFDKLFIFMDIIKSICFNFMNFNINEISFNQIILILMPKYVCISFNEKNINLFFDLIKISLSELTITKIKLINNKNKYICIDNINYDYLNLDTNVSVNKISIKYDRMKMLINDALIQIKTKNIKLVNLNLIDYEHNSDSSIISMTSLIINKNDNYHLTINDGLFEDPILINSFIKWANVISTELFSWFKIINTNANVNLNQYRMFIEIINSNIRIFDNYMIKILNMKFDTIDFKTTITEIYLFDTNEIKLINLKNLTYDKKLIIESISISLDYTSFHNLLLINFQKYNVLTMNQLESKSLIITNDSTEELSIALNESINRFYEPPLILSQSSIFESDTILPINIHMNLINIGEIIISLYDFDSTLSLAESFLAESFIKTNNIMPFVSIHMKKIGLKRRKQQHDITYDITMDYIQIYDTESYQENWYYMMISKSQDKPYLQIQITVSENNDYGFNIEFSPVILKMREKIYLKLIDFFQTKSEFVLIPENELDIFISHIKISEIVIEMNYLPDIYINQNENKYHLICIQDAVLILKQFEMYGVGSSEKLYQELSSFWKKQIKESKFSLVKDLVLIKPFYKLSLTFVNLIKYFL
jgi:hypothetical protein